jgi:uncharacterized protein YueI
MKILFINGAEIVMVSKLLRLNSNKITDIYTHVSTKNIQQIKSPFDDLKKHILTKSDLTSHIYLTYIQLAKESIEYKIVGGNPMTTPRK